MLKKTLHLCFAGTIAVLAASVGAQDVNKLSQKEIDAGYDLLWNGTDFSQWHAYRLTAVTNAWTIKTDGALGVRIQNGPGTKLPILTNKPYKNFDVKIDVQVPANGNSGIFVRYEEKATSPGNTRSGPEFQVCGPQDGDCGTQTRHFGSCYDMFGVNQAIRNSWYNPPGTWNQVRIIAYDSNYVHYGNGKKLLEYKIGTAEFINAYNHSKYIDDGNNGNYYNIHPGGILLQHHGEEGISFRNLKAKELKVHPFKQDFPDGKWPDNLPQDFVLGAVVGVSQKQVHTASEIAVSHGQAGSALVKVPFGHVGFHVVGIDGKNVPFRKISEGVYSIDRQGRASGIVIARVTAAEKHLTKLVDLQ